MACPFPRRENATALGARRDSQALLAGYSRDFDLASKGGCGEVDRHFAEDVVAVALEELVLADVDYHVEVSVVAAAQAAFALPLDAQPHAGVDSGRDVYLYFALGADAALARAFAAGAFGRLAFAVAGGAGLHDREEALRERDLALAFASGADLAARARFAAGALAGFAKSEMIELYGTVGPQYGVLEIDFELVAEIGSVDGAVRVAAPSAAARRVAEEGVEDAARAAAPASEDFAEDVEGIVVAAAPASSAVVEGAPAVLVVGSRLRSSEAVVGCGNLLELLLASLFPDFFVGMVFDGECLR
jgi:hypothetical protein